LACSIKLDKPPALERLYPHFKLGSDYFCFDEAQPSSNGRKKRERYRMVTR